MKKLHPILQKSRQEDPGSLPTGEELDRIEKDQPELAPLLKAAREALAKEKMIVKETVDKVLKKYDFKGRYDYGPEKCIRDVSNVYRYSVFAMMCEDEEMLKNKLLFWMRKIIQSLDFPGGNESIKYCYTLLHEYSSNHLSRETQGQFLPYLQIAKEILPS